MDPFLCPAAFSEMEAVPRSVLCSKRLYKERSRPFLLETDVHTCTWWCAERKLQHRILMGSFMTTPPSDSPGKTEFAPLMMVTECV